MTSPEPMAREELLELAGLDALGLLDEYEAELFTRSFHYAADTVRDEIIRLQAEVAADDSLLPADDASKDLRARVLALVAEAIERESTELAPIATFRNRSRRDGAPDSSGRWRLGPNTFWRAAVFALTGALIAMTYLWSAAVQEANDIATLALREATSAWLIEKVGPGIKDFLFDSSEKVVLEANPPNAPHQAMVFVNAETGSAFIVTDKLPLAITPKYVVSVIQANGEVLDLTTITSSQGVGGFRIDGIDLAANILATVTWRITDLTGTVLLTSA